MPISQTTGGMRSRILAPPRGRAASPTSVPMENAIDDSWNGGTLPDRSVRSASSAHIATAEKPMSVARAKRVPHSERRAALARRLAPRKAGAASAILAAMDYAHGLRGVVPQTDWDDFQLERLIQPLLEGQTDAGALAAHAQTKLERVMQEAP